MIAPEPASAGVPGRKVRTPKGSVVRNADCPHHRKERRDKESATENIPPCDEQGKGEKVR